ncbi:MAG: RNase H-like domain-containing protein [Candidatus Thiodiazotropha endolucinida]|nr:hypothetical protein [Candidatus Thiodiazotropha taylori]MCW4260920.1 RNase H-like domain-containing protein [Candidatus Thiodiazotropha endolucinida]
MAIRAPKQWSLTKNETITSFEAWSQNLKYTLSLDPNFASFLIDGSTWLKKSAANPLRGFTDDADTVPEASRRTAAQKLTQLELMLGQIANYCPIISRSTIVKNSTSIAQIWQSIRLHFGFQSSGAHFLDFDSIHLEPGERPEDLYQRLSSFVEDNLLKSDGGIRHHGEILDIDEDLSPTLENFIVLTWLRLIHPDLPNLVKQRYGTELRSQTLSTIKPEISQSLGSLLEEIRASAESKVLRSAIRKSNYTFKSDSKPSMKNDRSCVLCKQAGRPFNHFLSKCKYLPETDKQYLRTGKIRQNVEAVDEDTDSEETFIAGPITSLDSEPAYNLRVSTSRRVLSKQSPQIKVFYRHHPLQLILDTGAEISMIKTSVVQSIGATINKTSQKALQADGVTPLSIAGETRLLVSRDNVDLKLEALVVNDLDIDILAGIPFMTTNDISVRPSKQQILIGDSQVVYYGSSLPESPFNRIRRTQAVVLRSPTTSVVWPGDYYELSVPQEIAQSDCTLSIETRPDTSKHPKLWPQPQLLECIGGKVRIVNTLPEPQIVHRHEHFCQVRQTTQMYSSSNNDQPLVAAIKPAPTCSSYHSDIVKLDPDNVLSEDTRIEFKNLMQKYDDVFNPKFTKYNGAFGQFEATINMGPTQPPQRKGKVPQYARDKLVELQQRFDDLEAQGVFCRPEELGITAEYLNPSFLVKKPSGGFRLVTAFTDVGRYSKPQPSLMPDVDSTLRIIAQWKYMIQTDLTSAFYQIPLSKQSMKYCGVATPFRGVRVYTRCAMGMPGSETALEELMCRVLGDLLQEGIVAKLADDLYCGGSTPQELLHNWERVLHVLQKSDLRLAGGKTVISPSSTTVLGWIWKQGTISASPHRIAVLTSCPPPETIHGLRSFIGAYKVLGRVLPGCSAIISDLDNAVAGKQSQERVVWTDDLSERFSRAKQSLSCCKTITIPRPDDQLWIVTDGSVSKRGLGATFYVTRNNKLLLAGFFSAKLRKHQVTWLPCEIEALSIAAAVKHFSPFIIQSKLNTCVLTDSKPCVQAIDKLARGEFSASPRVTSFLSTISRYQVSVRHLNGSANVPSDFASRNAPECDAPRCQICNFIVLTEDSVVRSVQEIVDNIQRLPFTTRSSWLNIQSECDDLRRVHAHLKQGTRPSKKLTNIKDVKRYISIATIARDGLLVVPRNDPLSPTRELIIVPRSVAHGLVTALHLKLDHPSKHQLQVVMKRHFYVLDMTSIIESATDSCHVCSSLKKFPESLVTQSSEDPPDAIGMSFAADVLKQNRQLILVLRESVSSYTAACLIDNEKQETLRDALARLCLELHPIDGPNAVIRTDPAPGFVALTNDPILQRLNISIDIGRVKNVNKNPIAEKAISELLDELLRQQPGGGPVSHLELATAVARLNSRIRYAGISAREMWTQRSQFTHEQLPISDREIIAQQHKNRVQNHPFSSTSKNKNKKVLPSNQLVVGDLVYLYADRDKTRERSRYLVVSIDGEWCFIKKFIGNQLRSSSYKVKTSECYRVPNEKPWSVPLKYLQNSDSDDESDTVSINQKPPALVNIPPILTQPAEHDTGPSHKPEVPMLIGSPKMPGNVQELPRPPEVRDDTVEAPTVDPFDATDNSIETRPNISPPSRPRRNIKTPKYLEDYILK